MCRGGATWSSGALLEFADAGSMEPLRGSKEHLSARTRHLLAGLEYCHGRGDCFRYIFALAVIQVMVFSSWYVRMASLPYSMTINDTLREQAERQCSLGVEGDTSHTSPPKH